MDAQNDYFDFIGAVKDRIRSAQYAALKAVNKELVGLYWDIGRMISEKQKELGWGKAVVENIAKDLHSELPNQNGFSSYSLWSMVRLYNEYQGDEKLAPLVPEISWSHTITILKKCQNSEQRKYYLLAAKKYNWSRRVLEYQIENKTYEKYQLGQTSFLEHPNEKNGQQGLLAIKDHYTFNFLDLAEEHSERDLEKALINNMQAFLFELGGDFAFLGSQYKITVGSQDFYIDLLLYHRRLQSLVVIELKAGLFKPEYKGKLEFYLNVLNDTHRLPHENESVGIIICKTKDRVVVEYSLKNTSNSIGIASYSTGPELPEHYRKALPTAEQIGRGLRVVNREP